MLESSTSRSTATSPKTFESLRAFFRSRDFSAPSNSLRVGGRVRGEDCMPVGEGLREGLLDAGPASLGWVAVRGVAQGVDEGDVKALTPDVGEAGLELLRLTAEASWTMIESLLRGRF